MSGRRTEALLVTPLPPLETGLATYAERVLRNTAGIIDWKVAHTGTADTAVLPEGPEYLSLEDLQEDGLPAIRVFQVGNSPHCFPVVRALYRLGGTALFHETVLHHMLRHCYLEAGMLEEYRRELRFCYGPASTGIEKELSKWLPEPEYDALLKSRPLCGRTVAASSSAVCLNEYAAAGLRPAYPPGAVITIGHPLSPLPGLVQMDRPFSPCIGMVGGFHHGRNLEKVIEAITVFREAEKGAGLLLIGGGYPPGLPEWVMATGRLPEADYQSRIRTLDVVLDMRHPTCGETSGSLLEAMRAGIPSIVTASGSFLNLPSDGVIRLPPENIVQALPAALEMVLGDSRLRKRMSRASMEYAEDTGSAERLVRDWEGVITVAGRFAPGSFEGVNTHSLAPAWSEPPEGFTRVTGTGPVTWGFEGRVFIRGPSTASRGYLTACGNGNVNGTALPGEFEVMEFEGNDLEFEGSGLVSHVLWR
ncbi:MAG: hypothetical protein AVO35_03785 [Candidatus Aegiribacteria sp. MLS_C]|nr:MAG: hypothetical protein AVO35_03785 [Candidatus Aegiribacteria sp. MLS_C]